MPPTVEYYIHAFQHMNRASLCGYKAPHKPILLLCLIDMVEDGSLTSNRIYLSDELIARFNTKWKQLIDDGSTTNVLLNSLVINTKGKYPFKCSIDNPFYHLGHEPFWHLVKSDSFVVRSNYSISTLRESFKYAEIDDELLYMFNNAESRLLLQKILTSLI